ncbi:NnrS family protein [Sphingomonadaceae bacterium G21617-S1]|jgi:uncharacterized protein involved in response to NO|nr:NnrS family protein [Sphingomonadaceae bacterium G21617-S1]
MTGTATEQDHSAEPPIWLRGSFRLLFTGGALWALVVVALWVGALEGAWTLPTAMEPLAWHQHEMLFGYLGAVIAGFLSAAIPNWTGRPVIIGWPVAAFVGLWAAARLAVLFSAYVPPLVGAVLDVGFLLALFGYAARQIFAARNRNKPILIVLLLFAAACGLDHVAAMGLTADPAIGMRAGFALILMLIAIIGGRIIPAFTRNWLTKHDRTDGLPIMANRFDHAVLAVTVIALAGWAVAPVAHPVAWLLLGTGALHAVRLTRWAGLRAIGDPLVFVLHVAYAWLPAGLLLLGAATLWPVVSVSSAMHALGAGAMAAMTLAVMTRATRGHTGRPLEADGATVAIYGLVNLGALLRVAAPLLPFDYMLSIRVAGGLWGGAFLLFVLVYGRMALRRPAKGQA